VGLPRLTTRTDTMVEAEGEYYHWAAMRRAVAALEKYAQKPKGEG
jgi:hypothetical protein